jgi:hypothetical protein
VGGEMGRGVLGLDWWVGVMWFGVGSERSVPSALRSRQGMNNLRLLIIYHSTPKQTPHLEQVVPLPHRPRGADGRALPALDAFGQVQRPPLVGGDVLLVPPPDEADGACGRGCGCCCGGGVRGWGYMDV